VLPRFRRQGLYVAMVEERRRLAQAAGAHQLTVRAGSMSAPILVHLGFVEVGRLYDLGAALLE
jgi:hypothetical protein